MHHTDIRGRNFWLLSLVIDRSKKIYLKTHKNTQQRRKEKETDIFKYQ